jgi:hypothetical protein
MLIAPMINAPFSVVGLDPQTDVSLPMTGYIHLDGQRERIIDEAHSGASNTQRRSGPGFEAIPPLALQGFAQLFPGKLLHASCDDIAVDPDACGTKDVCVALGTKPSDGHGSRGPSFASASGRRTQAPAPSRANT